MAGWTITGGTISTSGNVGIGTATAQKPLDISEVGGIRISQTASASTDNEILFADNGQIRSLDENHRIIFNRAGNELELREYGMITLSSGATQGQRTAKVVVDNGGNMQVGGTITVTGTGQSQATTGFGSNVGPGSLEPPTTFASIGPGSMVLANTPGQSGPTIALTNNRGGVNTTIAIDFYTFGQAHDSTPSAEIAAIDMGNYANDIVFRGNQPGAASQALQERMRITNTGNIVVPGDILLTGADCAEQFDVSEANAPEPGAVVVIDEGGALRESREPYDKKVAGVVSGAGDYKHGIVLDRRVESKDRVPVALVGKVYCKVDAEYSPVEIGDLLTTSATPGHAMKAMDAAKAFGSVIGKALRPLADGKGLIPILVALQ
jgi:hypothetical protein